MRRLSKAPTSALSISQPLPFCRTQSIPGCSTPAQVPRLAKVSAFAGQHLPKPDTPQAGQRGAARLAALVLISSAARAKKIEAAASQRLQHGHQFIGQFGKDRLSLRLRHPLSGLQEPFESAEVPAVFPRFLCRRPRRRLIPILLSLEAEVLGGHILYMVGFGPKSHSDRAAALSVWCQSPSPAARPDQRTEDDD